MHIGRKGGGNKWIIAMLDMYSYCQHPDALERLSLYINQTDSEIFTEQPKMDPPYIPKIMEDTIHGLRRFGDNSME